MPELSDHEGEASLQAQEAAEALGLLNEKRLNCGSPDQDERLLNLGLVHQCLHCMEFRG